MTKHLSKKYGVIVFLILLSALFAMQGMCAEQRQVRCTGPGCGGSAAGAVAGGPSGDIGRSSFVQTSVGGTEVVSTFHQVTAQQVGELPQANSPQLNNYLHGPLSGAHTEYRGNPNTPGADAARATAVAIDAARKQNFVNSPKHLATLTGNPLQAFTNHRDGYGVSAVRGISLATFSQAEMGAAGLTNNSPITLGLVNGSWRAVQADGQGGMRDVTRETFNLMVQGHADAAVQFEGLTMRNSAEEQREVGGYTTTRAQMLAYFDNPVTSVQLEGAGTGPGAAAGGPGSTGPGAGELGPGSIAPERPAAIGAGGAIPAGGAVVNPAATAGGTPGPAGNLQIPQNDLYANPLDGISKLEKEGNLTRLLVHNGDEKDGRIVDFKFGPDGKLSNKVEKGMKDLNGRDGSANLKVIIFTKAPIAGATGAGVDTQKSGQGRLTVSMTANQIRAYLQSLTANQ